MELTLLLTANVAVLAVLAVLVFGLFRLYRRIRRQLDAAEAQVKNVLDAMLNPGNDKKPVKDTKMKPADNSAQIEAAQRVLAEAGQPMDYRDIAEQSQQEITEFLNNKKLHVPADMAGSLKRILVKSPFFTDLGDGRFDLASRPTTETEPETTPVIAKQNTKPREKLFAVYDGVAAGLTNKEIAEATNATSSEICTHRSNMNLFENPDNYKRGAMFHAWQEHVGLPVPDRVRAVAAVNPDKTKNYINSFVSHMDSIMEWKIDRENLRGLAAEMPEFAETLETEDIAEAKEIPVPRKFPPEKNPDGPVKAFEILDLVKAGFPSLDIAEVTGYNPRTVYNYANKLRLYEKPSVKTRMGRMASLWMAADTRKEQVKLITEAFPKLSRSYVRSFCRKMDVIAEWKKARAKEDPAKKHARSKLTAKASEKRSKTAKAKAFKVLDLLREGRKPGDIANSVQYDKETVLRYRDCLENYEKPNRKTKTGAMAELWIKGGNREEQIKLITEARPDISLRHIRRFCGRMDVVAAWKAEQFGQEPDSDEAVRDRIWSVLDLVHAGNEAGGIAEATGIPRATVQNRISLYNLYFHPEGKKRGSMALAWKQGGSREARIQRVLKACPEGYGRVNAVQLAKGMKMVEDWAKNRKIKGVGK